MTKGEWDGGVYHSFPGRDHEYDKNAACWKLSIKYLGYTEIIIS
jgi:hypothetical protein